MPSSEMTPWLFLLGLVVATAILLRRSLRYQRRRNTRPNQTKKGPASGSESATPLIDAPPEILRWQVEMHDTARNLTAELDSKMGALQVLIRMAREESARLEDAIRLARQLDLPADHSNREAG